MRVENVFSHFNLLVLNLWIGLCRGLPGLPTVIRELGFREKWVEHRFRNSANEEVHPELILVTERHRYTLLLESKEGQNTDREQLSRYTRITTDDLRERAFVPTTALDAFDLAVMGLGENQERLTVGLDGYDFPLLIADPDGVSIVANNFSLDGLDNAFRPRLDIDWSRVSYEFVQIDQRSELWEVAETVMPEVVANMQQRAPRITVGELAVKVCRVWSHLGVPGQQQLRGRIREVLEAAASQEFSHYLSWQGRGHGAVEIRNNPLDVAVSKQHVEYRRLQRLQKEFITRLQDSDSQLPLELENTT